MAHLVSVHHSIARSGSQETGQHLDRCRFTGAVGPEQSEYLPAFDAEIDTVNGYDNYALWMGIDDGYILRADGLAVVGLLVGIDDGIDDGLVRLGDDTVTAMMICID